MTLLSDVLDAQAVPDAAEQERLERLDQLGKQLAKTWDEAVRGRASSGIEQQWIEDEEHYEGIDDANRGVGREATQQKPPGQLAIDVTDGNTQSTEFVNITAPYVDAAAAKVGDILLPTDERSWSIGPTPIPELVEQAKGALPVEVREGLALLDVPEHIKNQVVRNEIAHARQLLEEAKNKAKRAEKRIEDWHIEGQYHAALREVIEDAARIGTGILKGPIPEKKRQQMFKDGALIIEEVTKPISKRVDCWNIFPQPGCGRNPHKGRYIWERDYVTPKTLEGLKGQAGYIDSQIDLCITEGPQKKSEPRKTADGTILDDKNTFEVRYYYGYATQEELEAAGWTGDPGDSLGNVNQIPVIFTMVNDRVIRGALNPLDTGEFPYDFFVWRRKKNSPWGDGVSRLIRTAQRIVTAGTRVMLTNAGRAAGPMVIVRDAVKGADGTLDIYAWKVFRLSRSDGDDTDVSKAIALIEIPALTNELMSIIQYGFKIAEDTTGLPMLLQGQKGDAPETYGGQQLVDRNASSTLRRLARTFDDTLTEPHIRRYYTYLLLYGEDDIEKGEFVIDARGSTALVERELERQEATALLQASLNPAFGLDPRKTMAEKLRADKRDPDAFQYTEEEWQKLQQQRSQQPPNPAVQVATIKEQGATQRQRDELAAQAKENALDRALQEVLGQINEHIQGMKSEGEQEQTIAQIKANLAEAAMKLSTQKQLNAADNAHEKDMAIGTHKMAHFKHLVPGAAKPTQVLTPPTEPPGKAPPGKAFEK